MKTAQKTIECDHRQFGFTLIELLVVIAIIGLLASLVVGLSGLATRSSRHSRIRAELNQLVTAIEAYKAKFGHYPPDNVVSLTPFVVVNSVTNQLFYELTGTIVEGTEFRTPNREEKIDSSAIQQFFSGEGFVHSAKDPKEIKPFITLKSTQFREISPIPPSTAGPDVEVLVVPLAWPLNSTFPQPTRVPGVNPWRYVSKNPTNNPSGFDLWAEFVEGKKIRIICNWSKDILDKPQ